MELKEQTGGNTPKIPTEYSPVVLDESIDDIYPNYEYGQTIRKLKPGIEVESSNSTVTSSVFGNATRTSTDGTGTQAITGIGFTPSSIEIIATRSASDGTGYISIGNATGSGDEYCIYSSPGATAGTGITDYSTSRIIYTANGRAELQSIDSDGFTLNWTTMTANVNFRYKCSP